MPFKNGDLVWAKMKGFPPWPGLVSHPPDGMLEGLKIDLSHKCIFFFGTRNFGCIEERNLKPYVPFKEKMLKICKSSKFKKACREIEEHQKTNQAAFNEDVEDVDTLNEAKSENDTAYDEEIDLHTQTESKTETDESFTVELEIDTQTETKSETDAVYPKRTDNNIEAKKKPSVIGGVGIGKLYPTIKLHKLHGIEDLLPLPDKPMDSIAEKRSLSTPKRTSKKKKVSNYSDADTTTPLDALCQTSMSFPSTHSKEENNIQNSDEHSDEEEEECNNGSVDEATDSSCGEISNSKLKIGFIGLGVMGRRIVRNLLQSGHDLVIWNRSPEKVTEFHNAGVTIATSPAEVFMLSKLIFCCVSDGTAAKHVMFQNGGGLFYLTPEKAFIDLSSSDVQSSLDLCEAVFSKGSRYLEVRLHGSTKEAEGKSLICLAAGDESLYHECEFFFQSCSKQSFFMGEAGNASKLNLIIQSITGVFLAGLAECMVLTERAGLDQNDLLKIMELSQINCPFIIEKAGAMVKGDFTTKMALKHLQKDLQNAITLGEEQEQPTPLTATANEIFKHAKKVGYSGHDIAAVYLAAKF